MKRQSRHQFLLAVATAPLFFISSMNSADAQTLPDKGAHVRILKNADGSSTQLKRDHTNTRLEQSSYIEKKNGEKIIRTRTIYRRDLQGKLRSGVIEDGQKHKLYRIIYGYDKNTGRLIAENMYDARVVRRNDPIDPKKETPVRALRYSYTSQGERSKPVVYVGVTGLKAEELKKWIQNNGFQNGVLRADPYRNQAVDPNARPRRR